MSCYNKLLETREIFACYETLLHVYQGHKRNTIQRKSGTTKINLLYSESLFSAHYNMSLDIRVAKTIKCKEISNLATRKITMV